MYDYELQKSADELIKTIFGVKKGETVVITSDTSSNFKVIDAVAASVYAVGAIPMVVKTATPKGVGKAADPDLPIESLTGALMGADVWIEMNKQWLLYSTPFERVEANHKNIRYMNLVEFNEDMLVRTIGDVDTTTLRGFMKKVAEMTKNAKKMHVTNAAGTDVSFLIEPKHLVSCDCGDATMPGIHMLTGQINVVPHFGSINGTIVFDGCLTPPYGRRVTEPVKMTIKDSIITKIDGGADAAQFEQWLRSFDDEGMFKLAHIAYGFNPGAKLTGNIVEDERVWGSTEWGIGYVSPYDAPPIGQDAKSHCDGICLNSSVWLDGHQIMDNGNIVDEELKLLYPMK
ncbi:MAG: aminopeptidase [Anaerovoracaceae bacterium]